MYSQTSSLTWVNPQLLTLSTLPTPIIADGRHQQRLQPTRKATVWKLFVL
jgi:hypothetical protein